MKIIVNRVVGPEPERYANVFGGRGRIHRIRTHLNLTDASLARIERLAIDKKTIRYDGENGRYLIQNTYRF